jgi:putative transposase
MLREDGQQLTGAPHSRGGGRVGHRWGTTEGKIGFHGAKVTVHRPRVRSFDGHEVALPSWTAAQAEDWLGRWAMNLMLINVSTRKLRRAVRRRVEPLLDQIVDQRSVACSSSTAPRR